MEGPRAYWSRPGNELARTCKPRMIVARSSPSFTTRPTTTDFYQSAGRGQTRTAATRPQRLRTTNWWKRSATALLSGNRTSETTEENGQSRNAGYRYDPDGLREEQNSLGRTRRTQWIDGFAALDSDQAGNPQGKYEAGPNGRSPVALISSLGNEYLHADALGSITQSTAGGSVLASTDYDAWGNASQSGSSRNKFGYTGHQPDGETGLIYFKARYYDPTLGRFIGEDPMEGEASLPLSWRSYLYANGNPLIYIDKDGNESVLDDAGALMGRAGGWLKDQFSRFDRGDTRDTLDPLIAMPGDSRIELIDSHVDERWAKIDYVADSSSTEQAIANTRKVMDELVTREGSRLGTMTVPLPVVQKSMPAVTSDVRRKEAGSNYDNNGNRIDMSGSVMAPSPFADPESPECLGASCHGTRHEPDRRYMDKHETEGLLLVNDILTTVGTLGGAAAPNLLRRVSGMVAEGSAIASRVAAKGGGDLVNMYRAVKPSELADIAKTNTFKSAPGLEGKYFTTSPEAATDYARKAVKAFRDPPYTIVETRVPRSVLNQPGISATVDGGIPAYVIPNASLPGLTPRIWNYSPLP